MYFTTSIAVVAGVCIGFGVFYLFVGLRRAARRSRNLLFAGFAGTYAGAILAARNAFMAVTTEQQSTSVRVSFVFAAAGFALLGWYVASYTGVRPLRFLQFITGMYIAIGIAVILFPDLFEATAGSTRQTLPWGETVLVFDAAGAQIYPLFAVAQVATIAYVIAANVTQFRRGERSEGLALAVALGWFVFTVVEEMLVAVGVLDFVVRGGSTLATYPEFRRVLSDFGFLGFVVAMGLEEVKASMDADQVLLSYQENLEMMVASRTRELEAAQAELLAQAEVRAAAEERTRLAQELHDAVTQLLFSINLIAGSLPARGACRDANPAARAAPPHDRSHRSWHPRRSANGRPRSTSRHPGKGQPRPR